MDITLKEDLSTLKSFTSNVYDFKSSQKLRLLISLSSIDKDVEALKTVSEKLSIPYSTAHRWFKDYKEKGIEAFLSKNKRNKPSKIITPLIHQELETILKNPKAKFNGYKDVQEWLKREHNIDIEYQWLWKYMTTKLKTSLKVPRNNHIKKDSEAQADFFKTP